MFLLRKLMKTIFLTLLIAVLSQLAAAQSVLVPEQGQRWTLSMHNASQGHTAIGTVNFVDGQYDMDIRSVDKNGKKIPMQIEAKIRSTEVNIPNQQIVFDTPKYVSRTSFSIFNYIATYVGSLGVPSVSKENGDPNNYISDPNLKLGTFLGGKLLSAAEEQAHDLKRISEGVVGGHESSVFFYPALVKQNEMNEFLIASAQTGSDNISKLPVSVPFEFSKSNFSTGEIVTTTRLVDLDLEVNESIRNRGANLELRNPQTDDGGKTISWNWVLKIDGQNKFETSGSREDGNPIIWGPAPEIIDVLVLNDQERIIDVDGKSKPLFPWLDPQAQARVNVNQNSFERELLIVGNNIKGMIGKTPKSSLPALSYGPVSEISETDILSRLREIHPSLAIDQLAENTYRSYQQRGLDILSTRVKIKSSTNAQVSKFAVNDIESEWPLLFGSHFGEIRIVRVDVPSAEKFSTTLKQRSGEKSKTREEIADPIVFRDEVLFEVEFDHVPDELPVTIALEDAGAKDGISEVRAKKIALEPVGGGGKLYRSERFIVVNSERFDDQTTPQSESAIDTYSDVPIDRMLAWEKDKYLRPRLTNSQTAFPLPDAIVLGGQNVTGNFISALESASKCYPGAPKVNWKTISADEELDYARKKATTLTPGFSLISKSVDINYGQHAAMLMLREAYYPYIQQSLDLAKSYIGSKNVNWEKLEPTMYAMWQNKATAISHFPGRKSNNLHEEVQRIKKRHRKPRFYEVYGGRDIVENGVTRNVGGRKLIHHGLAVAVVDAMRKTIREIETSIETARNTKTCDVENLLLITGSGFAEIVEDLQTKVFRYDIDGNIKKIRPDLAGRRALESIYIYRDIFDAYGDEANAWVTLAKLVGALVSVGATEFGALGAEAALSAKFAAAAGITVATADLGYTLVDNYKGYHEDNRRLDFARGASVRFGKEYLKKEADKTTDPLWRLVDIGGAAGGGFADIAKITKGSDVIADAVTGLRSSLSESSIFRQQADDVLDAANSALATYGDVTKKSVIENFRTIAEGIGEQLTKSPEKTLANMSEIELAAVKELLGTPTNLLSNRFRKTQEAIRRALEAPAPSRALESLASSVPDAPDVVDAISDYAGDEKAQEFTPKVPSIVIENSLKQLELLIPQLKQPLGQ